MLGSACCVILLCYFNAGIIFFYQTAGLTLSPVNLLNNASAESTGFLKGSYDAISGFPFSLDYYKLIVRREDPWSCKD